MKDGNWHLMVLPIALWAIYKAAFDHTGMPYKPKKMLTKIEKEAGEFRKTLGTPSTLRKYATSGVATLRNEYANDNNQFSEKELDQLFIDLGWQAATQKSVYGDLKIYCKGFIQGKFSHATEKNTVRISFNYQQASPCFEAEYKKWLEAKGEENKIR